MSDGHNVEEQKKWYNGTCLMGQLLVFKWVLT